MSSSFQACAFIPLTQVAVLRKIRIVLWHIHFILYRYKTDFLFFPSIHSLLYHSNASMSKFDMRGGAKIFRLNFCLCDKKFCGVEKYWKILCKNSNQLINLYIFAFFFLLLSLNIQINNFAICAKILMKHC